MRILAAIVRVFNAEKNAPFNAINRAPLITGNSGTNRTFVFVHTFNNTIVLLLAYNLFLFVMLIMNPNSEAISFVVCSPFMAARTTLLLNSLVYRLRFVIVASMVIRMKLNILSHFWGPLYPHRLLPNIFLRKECDFKSIMAILLSILRIYR